MNLTKCIKKLFEAKKKFVLKMTGFLTIWYNHFQSIDIVLDVTRDIKIIAST